jgi:hypothetical protein
MTAGELYRAEYRRLGCGHVEQTESRPASVLAWGDDVFVAVRAGKLLEELRQVDRRTASSRMRWVTMMRATGPAANHLFSRADRGVPGCRQW